MNRLRVESRQQGVSQERHGRHKRTRVAAPATTHAGATREKVFVVARLDANHEVVGDELPVSAERLDERSGVQWG